MKYTLLSKSVSSWNSEKLNPACLSLASASIVGFYCPVFFASLHNKQLLNTAKKTSSY